MLITQGTLLLFVLIAVRIMSCLILLPIFGSSGMFNRIKGALAILLAFLLFPSAGLGLPAPSLNLGYLFLAAEEVLIGLMMGFLVQLAFSIVSVAGEMVSQEMGFRMSEQMDPLTGTNSPAVTQLYNLVMLLTFFCLNGHYWILEVLSRSFRAVPIGSLQIRAGFGEWFVHIFTRFFGMGIQVAAPLFMLMLMISVGIGILAKIVEGMNVFDIGFPIRIGAGLLFLMLFMPYLNPTLHRVYAAVQEGLFGLLKVV